MNDRRLPQTILGFAVGLGVGAALGILFAPKSGEDTRKHLLDGAKDAVDDAVATGRKFTRRAKRAADDIAERVVDVTESVEHAYQKAKGA